MKLTRSGGRTAPGPGDWFTGAVFIDAVRDPDHQSAIGCAHVRFAPGARTAWHHHPKGQTLYVTDGIGYVARRGGQVQEIRPGDVVHIEPGEEHWHGATPDRFMAHIALQEPAENGSVVTWLEHVDDSDYNRL
ncbi:(R)-mandelonitrile lyase [Cellulomonas fimi]|uniref:Cupin 2 conserved barrel domain protein n=1 Tax=Cellulomonas fimi (strain ATCC 484 / DSM 20113 / JCM 1341 / CCUG 24087 / LMG 16345 / NBRC 15513 / NCIMB 8980 / NCTC 7547 / NRS-133) TaxID=590998 RepID=F4H7P0_CELFA|nr:cupin domain-containing protein [Cellulomonas fimi]AEE44597.1 Cupin 2 conserved barrel domain protein [Cellulomonas fimi ATCC 484]NNH09036.1 cupin domain-containing protein [Cellulomonas fimi]VEH26735.1 Cupin domain [Cellulomonas fimi]